GGEEKGGRRGGGGRGGGRQWRGGGFAAAAAPAACSPAAPPHPAGTSSTATGTSAETLQNAWFICDGTDAPTVLAFFGGPPGQTARMIEYTKPTGATAGPQVEYQVGEGDGAMGSIYTPLLLNGAEAGRIRAANPGMLEPRGSACTEVITEVTLGERSISCRWLPRTRLMGFSGKRTFVISEDADGDLIYDTYDFSRPPSPPIDVSENGRTNTFSAEVRGGTEHSAPPGVVFSFAKNGYRYVVNADTGRAQVQVFRGDRLLQTEDMAAVEFGTAAHGTTP